MRSNSILVSCLVGGLDKFSAVLVQTNEVPVLVRWINREARQVVARWEVSEELDVHPFSAQGTKRLAHALDKCVPWEHDSLVLFVPASDLGTPFGRYSSVLEPLVALLAIAFVFEAACFAKRDREPLKRAFDAVYAAAVDSTLYEFVEFIERWSNVIFPAAVFTVDTIAIAEEDAEHEVHSTPARGFTNCTAIGVPMAVRIAPRSAVL